MGETNIGCTNYSWNPWVGCRKVSSGCKNCYMFRDQNRFGTDPTNIRRTTPNIFNQTLKLKEPTRIFVCSWSDFFIEEADEWRDDAWDIIRRTPHLTYQILTKRPENIRSKLPDDWGDGWNNVWLGVSMESYKQSKRADILSKIPAKVRFISAEPLLDWIFMPHLFWEDKDKLHWIIVGGESGPNYRQMDLEWARDIRDYCKYYDVAFFMKQDSGPKPGMRGRIPDNLWVQEFPTGFKKKGESHADT